MHIIIKKINAALGVSNIWLLYTNLLPILFSTFWQESYYREEKKTSNAFSSIISWQRKLVFTSLLNNPLTKKIPSLKGTQKANSSREI